MSARPKYYAVARGRDTGVFRDWSHARSLVDGFPGAIHKSFPTEEAARAFLQQHGCKRPRANEAVPDDDGGEATQPVLQPDSPDGGAPLTPTDVEDGDDAMLVATQPNNDEDDDGACADVDPVCVPAPRRLEVPASPAKLAVVQRAPARKDEEKPTFGQGAYRLDDDKSGCAPAPPPPAPPLEALTDEQRAVVDACLGGKNVFFTGSAGTGKSFVLRAIVEQLRAKQRHVYVTASTGIAASHINGTTVHFFGGTGIVRDTLDRHTGLLADIEDRADVVANKVKFAIGKSAEDARTRWRTADVLIIDEISMLEADFFDVLDITARWVILSGDFLQLPPVVSNEAMAMKKGRVWCFQSRVWPQLKLHTAILRKVHRQNDLDFVHVLQELRVGRVSANAVQMLQSRVGVALRPPAGVEATRLYPTNALVHAYNARRLAELPGPVRCFTAVESHSIHLCPCADVASASTQDCKALAELRKSCMAPPVLELAVGAQVLLLRNLNPPSLVNGSKGVVVDFRPRPGQKPDSTLWPVVRFESGTTLILCPEKWTLDEHIKRERVTVASIEQVPLTLGWAVTIHKSQGMSLTYALVDASRSFANGQTYVALSRVTSLEGLAISGFDGCVRTAPEVLAFYAQLEAAKSPKRQ